MPMQPMPGVPLVPGVMPMQAVPIRQIVPVNQAPSSNNTTTSETTTVYVGKIPKTTTDDLIRKLLEVKPIHFQIQFDQLIKTILYFQ